MERYAATVTSIDDPENRGRIMVSCVGLAGDEDAELPMFVEPAFDWGWFYVPDVGEIVEVEVMEATDEDESYQQFSIDNLDIHWRGKRFITDGTILGENRASPVNDAFTSENYGKRRGFATPFGHVLLFDDTEGDTRIFLTLVKDKPLLGEPTISQILMDSDGSIKLSVLGKQFVHLKENDQLEVSLGDGSHTLIIKPDQMEFKLGGGASVKVTGSGADAFAEFGNALVKVVIGERFEELYNQLKTKLDLFDKHIHPTGVGPSGTPTPIIDAPEYDPDVINSDHLKIPPN